MADACAIAASLELMPPPPPLLLVVLPGDGADGAGVAVVIATSVRAADFATL
jgi:hypothetical protein